MGEKRNVEIKPAVSVIMPAYNMERFVEQAIRSVIAQTFLDWELIVVDDCSSDGTWEILQKLAEEDSRIHVVRNERNLGVAKTRDVGIEKAAGTYVAFLDSDDVWCPPKLEVQLNMLRQTGANLVYSSYAIIDAEGKKARSDYIVPASVTYQEILKENYIGCSTVLMEKDLAQKYRFSTGFYHEDYVLWVRILQDGYKAVGCKEILTKWRFGEDSRSFNKYKAARNRWRIYRGYFKLPLWKCIVVFCWYAFGGVKKYWK